MSPTIASAAPRHRTTLRGEIQSVTTYERPFVRTDAIVGDGTGTLIVRFVGRTTVPGVEVGRRVVVEGTPALAGDRLVMLNPLYSFDGAG